MRIYTSTGKAVSDIRDLETDVIELWKTVEQTIQSDSVSVGSNPPGQPYHLSKQRHHLFWNVLSEAKD